MNRLNIAILALAEAAKKSAKVLDDSPMSTYNTGLARFYVPKPKESWQNSGKRNKPRIK